MRSTSSAAVVPPAELGFDLTAVIGGSAARAGGEGAASSVVRAALRAGAKRFVGPEGVEAAVMGDVRLGLHLRPSHDLSAPVRAARERLGPGGRLEVVLDGAAVLAEERLWTRLLALRDQGFCEAIGLAAGPGGDALGLARRFKPDLMEVHAGLLDQRPIHSGALQGLAEMGVAIHLRTALLHGLLFLPREALPAPLADAGPLVSRARRAIAEGGADPLQAALAFALYRPEASAVIVEAGSVGEVRALLAAAAAPLPELDWPSLALDHAAALDAEAELYRRIAA